MVKSSQNEGGQKLKFHKYARYVLTFGQKHSKIKNLFAYFSASRFFCDCDTAFGDYFFVIKKLLDILYQSNYNTIVLIEIVQLIRE